MSPGFTSVSFLVGAEYPGKHLAFYDVKNAKHDQLSEFKVPDIKLLT
jgi:hypothetical protein